MTAKQEQRPFVLVAFDRIGWLEKPPLSVKLKRFYGERAVFGFFDQDAAHTFFRALQEGRTSLFPAEARIETYPNKRTAEHHLNRLEELEATAKQQQTGPEPPAA